ncbi:MAG: ATP-binding protein [Acidiferrobacterales bacterium]
MTQEQAQNPTKGIVHRLILLIVFFSALITLFISIVQLYSEYQNDVSAIDSRFHQIQDVNLKTLNNALWVADTQELKTQLQGLLRLPDMQYLEIRENNKIWAAVGEPVQEDTISHQYAMVHEYRGREFNIGTLTVVATLKNIYSRLVRRAMVILVSNGIKTFLVAGFITYIFQQLITRHLVKIADYTANYDMSDTAHLLQLDRKENPRKATDELGILVAAINKMHANLKQSFDALRENEKKLKHHQLHLEELVRERTERLETAQETLVRNERLAALGQLTATVSHELRNPLNAMQPSLYIIRNQIDPGDKNVIESVDRIDRNLKRCDRIIDELLDFTRITSLQLAEVNLDDWIKSVIGELEIDPKIKIEWDLNLTGMLLRLDPERMRRAVTNVVVNACQAMLFKEEDHPGDSANILTIQTRNTGQRLELNIRDTGPGISPGDREKVFEPLYSTKNFGVGLGMPIVKQIMELHRGGVEIESEPGKGTMISLWLPAGV